MNTLSTHEPGRPSLASVFRPMSVAVVGASPTTQWGRQAIENFTRLGFAGDVAAVNPKYNEILGYRCYPSLRDIPFTPETVLIGVGRDRVLPVIEEAALVGTRAAVVFAIGFAEAGPDGVRLQERLAAVAREAGMAVIGPNCQGAINFVRPCALYMGVVQPYEPGYAALFAQSGSVTTALLNNRRGVRWSHAVSCGNEAVTDSADLIAYFVDDPHTRVICGFIETIRDPDRFFRECERAWATGKPVIVLKPGRTEAARRAATAHSGALAAPDRLYNELFRRHGVLRVDSQEELLETAIALQSRRRPAGGRVAAVTGSGGQIELILDETTGKHREVLTHPELTSSTQSFLRGILPDFLATSNPLDYWGVSDHIREYPRILGSLAADPNVDIVVGVVDPNHGPTGGGGGEDRIYRAAVATAAESEKLITLITPLDGEPPAPDVERLLAADVLLLSGFPEGFRALERLVSWTRPIPPRADAPAVDIDEIERRMAALRGRPSGGQPALDLLAAAGIPAVRGVAVTNADDAVLAAEELGYPVVAKAGDAGTLHKTEAGAVYLGLDHAAAVREAVASLLAANVHMVLLQSQIERGIETILGLQADPLLGTFVLVGAGGIWTEVFADVSMRPVGLLVGEAARMLAELRSWKLLQGARGARPVNLGALTDAIARLDAVGQVLGPKLKAVDVNPLIVTETGVVAVDALIVPR